MSGRELRATGYISLNGYFIGDVFHLGFGALKGLPFLKEGTEDGSEHL